MVRNPYDRVISMMKYPGFFFGGFDLEQEPDAATGWYRATFGSDVTVEYDHRFFRYDDVAHRTDAAHSVYSNFFGNEVDYVVRLETIDQDVRALADILDQPFAQSLPRLEASPNSTNRSLFYRTHPQLACFVKAIHGADFDRYGYCGEPY